MESTLIDRLNRIALTLVDQRRARVLVPPKQPKSGFWFGGGNMVQDRNGSLWLVGRYRNAGDSRTGLGAGERGLELALFRSDNGGESFEKSLHFSKSDLNVGDRKVLSIEGSALRMRDDGVELYVSTEKSGIGYPTGLESFLKPGTGVWTIDRIVAKSIEELPNGKIETVLETRDPRFIHIKDPFLGTHGGKPCLLFCSHPFCWTSSNTGYVLLDDQPIGADRAVFDFFPRGFTWDVAMTRGTAMLPLPRVGVLADRDIALIFYDGGECVRNLDEHEAAVKRPRGYSCEELGGLALCVDNDLSHIERVSVIEPAFVSPHGSGCSRYVDVYFDGRHYFATWQQAQSDGSQPLMLNRVPRDELESLLR
jgi:hypothetical protein